VGVLYALYCLSACVLSGEVLHKFWLSQHPSEPKPYTRMADVLGKDPFISIVDGPHQRNERVQLDIVKLAAAATAKVTETAEEATGGWQTAAARARAAGDGTAEHGNGNGHASSACSSSAGGSSSGGGGTATTLGRPQDAAIAAAAGLQPHEIAARAQSGQLLVVDLLGFADLYSWHASNTGLHVLRQQLAYQIVQAANPGIVEAVTMGRQLLANTDESSYAMSPYAAGAALVAIWNQHHPDQPRPYTTLPSAFDGDRWVSCQDAVPLY
jgi:hypothetical protein